MNAPLCLTTLLAVVCLSGALTPEFKQKFNSAITACMKEHNVDKQEVMEILKTDKLPEDKAKQCVAGCGMDKMGYVKDLTFDWEAAKADNPEKFDTPEEVEKANQVMDACAKTVTGKATDICELGVKAMKCFHEEAEKVQLQRPDFQLD